MKHTILSSYHLKYLQGWQEQNKRMGYIHWEKGEDAIGGVGY